MIIDIVPVWVLFFVMIGIIVLSIELGFRLGKFIRGKTDDERESPASSISGVILGLQAFMLAFTFSIVSDRYDTKKALVREEANAIRTAWNRANFLPEPDRGTSKALFRQYVDARLDVVAAGDLQLVRESLADARRMQQQLWRIAVVHGKTDLNSDIGSLYVDSINEIARLHAERVTIGLDLRIPTAIWAVLFTLLVLGMIGVGYHMAIADSRRSRVIPILAVSFSLVVALVAALDHPGTKLMPVPQKPLVDVQSEMMDEAMAGT